MQQRKRLPIGIDDFKKLIEHDFYYVDKSMFIKEFWDSRAEATLIPRPRRFGKTLNLSMFRYFFEKPVLSRVEGLEDSNRYLFNGLAIEQYPELMALQGQYPVIWLTFKDVKNIKWDGCLHKIKRLIAREYERHKYLLTGSELTENQKKIFRGIVSLEAVTEDYEDALKNLSHYLDNYHGRKPFILIDEYDSPIHAGFNHGYYDEIITFMKSFLCGGLKGNVHLAHGIMTGILRVSKESVFSGLNNLEICSLASNRYADKFGLTEQEVERTLEVYGVKHKIDDVKSWYNGYTSGSHTIYNPWSIMSFVKNDGDLKSYWVNMSDNVIIQDLVTHADESFKTDIEDLITGKALCKELNENIIFADVFKQGTKTTWNFLLFCGYLTFRNKRLIEERIYADFSIPNKEVLRFFKDVIQKWFEDSLGVQNYNRMLRSLVSGDIDSFEEFFEKTVMQTLSMFDVGKNEPERFYHAFVLGMLVSLNSTHEIKSNRESGLGRYDVMVIPRDTGKLGVIIEFKTAKEKETLEIAMTVALQQIEDKQYEQELLSRGIKKIKKLGIVFKGKEVLIKEGGVRHE